MCLVKVSDKYFSAIPVESCLEDLANVDAWFISERGSLPTHISSNPIIPSQALNCDSKSDLYQPSGIDFELHGFISTKTK